MHVDLASHLHTDKCNELIKLLKDCHEQNPALKFFGICNSYDSDMRGCLRQERLVRTRKNFEKSVEMKQKMKQIWERKRLEGEL
ncbi:unnamed protein product [Brassicogethes aeneus]|uniref:COX assembly mitochondrial protein n=1 Tax=Brassicogethes aeneus TaxID=1431903 RepID=A0A9P0BHK0_BRAAE|nr:unnamed protein product [Brassicogethes aeneus]